MKTSLPLLCLAAGLLCVPIASCAQNNAPAAPIDIKTQTPAASPELKAELQKLDALYAGYLPWIASLYDAPSGGFFAGMEAKKRPNHGPDIQSSNQAMVMILESGHADALSPAVKQKWADYYLSRQLRDGFFADPDYPQMRDNPRTMARALAFSTDVLNRLEAKPKYPVPGGEDAATRPAWLQSEAAWQAWLEKNLGKSPGWSELDKLSAQGEVIKGLPAAERQKYAEIAMRYVEKVQNPDTGLLQSADDRKNKRLFDGAFKASSFAQKTGVKMPRADKIVAQVLTFFRSTKPGEGINDAPRFNNPIRLLEVLSPDLETPLSQDDLLTITRWYVGALPEYQEADGGMARYPNFYGIRPNDMVMDMENVGPQSELNGAKMIFNVRQGLYNLAGVPVPPLPGREVVAALK